jgi:hypothetical protein
MQGTEGRPHQVRNQSCSTNVSDGLLRRLCLLLALNHRDQGYVNLHKVPFPSPSFQLTHGLDERSALNVADCPTQFDNANIRGLVCVIDRNPRDPLDPVLDCICQVRHNLHRLPKIVATTFTLNDMLVYLSSSNVVLASESNVKVSFVVAKIEVHFAAIVEDKDFTVPVIRSATPA